MLIFKKQPAESVYCTIAANYLLNCVVALPFGYIFVFREQKDEGLFTGIEFTVYLLAIF